MEAKQRTEEQIQARVKKLGLSAAPPASTDATDEPAGAEAEPDQPASGEEDSTKDGQEDSGSAKRVRKLKRKSQVESDEDSEGLFSSVEV